MSAEPNADAAAAVAAARAVLGAAARVDEPLAPFTTYRVGGPAALFVEVDTPATLALVGEAVARSGVNVLVIGNGSNLLIRDAGFAGLAVRLGGQYRNVAIDGTRVTAGGAAKLPVVARETVQAGLDGFVWAVGVPGTIGGAVRMNAGGHGSDMAAVVSGVRVFDAETGETHAMPAVDLDFGYRRSALRAHQVVLDATLELRPVPAGVDGADELREIVRWRRANQPGGANAGSVFTNPPGDSAGRLIDTAGCKGLRIGTAAVSEKHANFIQADPDGRASDVVAVMAAVRDRVVAAHGVHLVAETVLVGFDDHDLARPHGGSEAGES